MIHLVLTAFGFGVDMRDDGSAQINYKDDDSGIMVSAVFDAESRQKLIVLLGGIAPADGAGQ